MMLQPRVSARAIAFAALLWFAAPAAPRAQAQEAPGPDSRQQETLVIPEPVGFVNDRAEVMTERDRAKLEAFLDQVREKTGAEFAILTVPTTEPLTPEQYKVEVFQRWGLGRKGVDDGLLMLVAVEERVVRFETGYGLEGTLPDGLQSRIFRREMRPHFREGDYTAGITAGVLACAARIAEEKGVKLEWDGRELRYRSSRRPAPPALVALIVFAVVVMMVLAASNRGGGGRRRRRGTYWGAGPWYGGGWGGGFGGGGGGGGGFGGFGGGASGGGGGGGSW